METIDAVLYINLEHREDRHKHILNQIELMGIPKEKVHRIAGIYNKECGHIGCAEAHISAFNLAKQNKWSKIIILEDDFSLKIKPEELDNFIRKADIVKWDVLLLALGHNSLQVEKDGLRKVDKSTTTSGYIVKEEYYDTLLTTFNMSLDLMKKQLQKFKSEYKGPEPIPKLIHGVKAIDMCWRDLHKKDNFYVGEPVAGKQGGFKSDTF